MQQGATAGVAALAGLILALRVPSVQAEDAAVASCPPEMVRVRHFCVDRYEASMVDKHSGTPLSPFYPPHPGYLRRVHQAWDRLRHTTGGPGPRAMPLPRIPEWQINHTFEPKAVSVPAQVPQAYVSYYMARQACANAGKRLCSDEEWVTACRGKQQRQFPYGNQFRRGPCNVYRYFHPAQILHDASFTGHLDPRLNLLTIAGDAPVLRLTGASQGCASEWGADAIYDMVGNLDEWIEDEAGAFRGGFYARSTTKGCEAQIKSHSPLYFDYSVGVRCCSDLVTAAP